MNFSIELREDEHFASYYLVHGAPGQGMLLCKTFSGSDSSRRLMQNIVDILNEHQELAAAGVAKVPPLPDPPPIIVGSTAVTSIVGHITK